MNNNTQCRKWQLTLNNPAEHGFDHDKIKEILKGFKSIIYWCMSDEVGLEEKTLHTHLFVMAKSPIKFQTLQNNFPGFHLEPVKGTALENRDYVAKTGRWMSDQKAETKIEGSFEESSDDLPEEPGRGFRSDIAEVYNLIVDGKSNAEIMSINPNFAGQISYMDKIRLNILEDRYRKDFRKLEVVYIFGPTETGKTRFVMDKNEFSEVFRVTDFSHPFDMYRQQPILCLDEFRSSLPIGDMLNYLDGYPLLLPARYAQRVACYEVVYIISNIDLSKQYVNVQMSEPETWKAFARRIHKVIEFRKDASPIEHGSALEYLQLDQPEKAPEAPEPPAWTQIELSSWSEDEARLWEVNADEEKAG